MSIRLSPHLSFPHRTAAAMAHYRDVLGGRVRAETFASGVGDRHRDAVLHSRLVTTDGATLCAADVPGAPAAHPVVSVSLSGDDEDRLRACFAALSAGGVVLEPIARAPWGDLFGMCLDRYGVSWMVDVTTRN